MSEPGSSGKAGPTPIPTTASTTQPGEQVRPAFHFGPFEVQLGDQVTGIHRDQAKRIVGNVVLVYGVVCLSTTAGVYPLDRISIQEVQPPLFE